MGCFSYYANQTIESDGVFFADPTLGDLEVNRFHDDDIEDEFDNLSLTLEGSIGDLEVVYAGAYTDRALIKELITLIIFLSVSTSHITFVIIM